MTQFAKNKKLSTPFSNSIETTVQSLLVKGTPIRKIAKQLLKKKAVQTNANYFHQVCRFLYQAGLDQMLIQVCSWRLKNKKIIPWSFLIETLSSRKIQVPKKIQRVFLKGIHEQKQIKEMLTSRSWDHNHPELQEWKTQTIQIIFNKKNKNFIKLMEDLEFIQSQGVLQKEEEILKKLKKIDPQNPDIQEKWNQFKEKWGRHIIRKKKQELLTKTTPPSPPPKEELEFAKKLLSLAKKMLKKQPQLGENLALLFSFIGYPRMAVSLLENQLHSSSSEWLYIDLLLQSQLYVSCLSFADYMEMKYKNNPDTVFALSYTRSKAYYGLGKKQKAKNILKELLKIRPNYRLIYVLLEQWEKGVEH